jgi:hypothetical protein
MAEGKPEVRHFTKDSPVTKAELWACFRGRRGWKRVQVDTAHSIIGLNAPRYMLTKEYVTRVTDKGADYYALTAEGQEWLLKGTRAFLRNHPEARASVPYPPAAA